jgi:hypothetical protein
MLTDSQTIGLGMLFGAMVYVLMRRFRTYHYNGNNWYERRWSLWQHIRTWFIWIGGWEKANGKGWKLFSRRARGWRLRSPAPISLFGYRVTWYSWGLEICLGEKTFAIVRRSLQVYEFTYGPPLRSPVYSV